MGSDSNVVFIAVEVVVVAVATVIAIVIITWVVIVCMRKKRMARTILYEKK